jgi:hypothetical protein
LVVLDFAASRISTLRSCVERRSQVAVAVASQVAGRLHRPVHLAPLCFERALDLVPSGVDRDSLARSSESSP